MNVGSMRSRRGRLYRRVKWHGPSNLDSCRAGVKGRLVSMAIALDCL